MAITVQTIRDRLPEFCDTDNDLIQSAITQAEGCINTPEWGENRAEEAAIYLAGHFLAARSKGNALASGPIASQSEGSLSVSYAVSDAFKNSVYGSTAYGRMFLELRRTAWPSRVI